MPYKTEEFTIKLEPVLPDGGFSVPLHRHLGSDSPKVSFKDLDNFIEVVSSVPTSTPRNIFNQIKIYISGDQSSLFIYETTNKTWKYSNLK